MKVLVSVKEDLHRASESYKGFGDTRIASDIELKTLLTFLAYVSSQTATNLDTIKETAKYFLENRGFLYAKECEI